MIWFCFQSEGKILKINFLSHILHFALEQSNCLIVSSIHFSPLCIFLALSPSQASKTMPLNYVVSLTSKRIVISSDSCDSPC